MRAKMGNAASSAAASWDGSRRVWVSSSPRWIAASVAVAKPGGVSTARELALRLQRAQPVAEQRLPASERVGERQPCLLVGLGELRRERADRTAAARAARALMLDHAVEPGADRPPALQRTDRPQHALGIVICDRAQQRRPVVEVVIELPLADTGLLDHGVETGRRDPAVGDQVAGHGDDPLARRPSTRRLGALEHDRTLRRTGPGGPVDALRTHEDGAGVT